MIRDGGWLVSLALVVSSGCVEAASGPSAPGTNAESTSAPVGQATSGGSQGVARVSTERPLRAGRCPPATPEGESAGETKAKCIARKPIAAVIRRARPQVRGCYDGMLARDRVENARVVVRFAIEPDGSVACSDVTSQEGGDEAFGACVADAVLPLRFPAGNRGRIHVNYPFVVQTEGP